MSATKTVFVDVLDINDHKPVCSSIPLIVKIPRLLTYEPVMIINVTSVCTDQDYSIANDIHNFKIVDDHNCGNEGNKLCILLVFVNLYRQTFLLYAERDLTK